MDYKSFIKSELIVLIPVLYLIGKALKRSKIADKYIPSILGIISIVLSALWVFATECFTGGREVLLAFFTAVTQGVLAAGASVYASQLNIQSKKEK